MFNIVKNPSPAVTNPKWSSQFKDFVAKTVDKNPEKRWSIEQLLGHPWMVDAGASKAAFVSEINAWKNTPSALNFDDIMGPQ